MKSLAVHARESAAFFDPIEMAGRSVLDIGAWNGAYAFEAKRRGAARVLATDHYTWNAPRYRGRETFELARSVLGLDVEAEDIDVPDICAERVGTFDVVLFLGVFYHLLDPVHGLALAASVTREVLVVETHCDGLDLERPGMVFYPGRELNNDATNWWGPNPACMVELLRALGFTTIDAAWGPANEPRAVFHAWRSGRLRRSGEPPASLDLSAAPQGTLLAPTGGWPRPGWLRGLIRRSRRAVSGRGRSRDAR